MMPRFDRKSEKCGNGVAGSWTEWMGVCLCLGALFVVAGTIVTGQNQPINPPKPHPILMPEANRPPDANEVMLMREQQAKKQNYEAANIERKKQLDDDSTRLLKLAANLKAELDKSSTEALSPDAIAKVGEIERLAHIVKEKMKLTVGSN